MPYWKSTLLRRWLFKGRNWIFSSDGEQFELVWDRGTRVVQQPLLMIHQFECEPSRSFSRTYQCIFRIGADTGEVTLDGLDSAKASELQSFIAENGGRSVEAYARRAADVLNPWKQALDERLKDEVKISEQLIKEVRKSIPSCEDIGLHSWSGLFNHSAFEMKQRTGAPAGLHLAQTPTSYLDLRIETFEVERFLERRSLWKGGQEEWITTQAWIGKRALRARKVANPPPEVTASLRDRMPPGTFGIPDKDLLAEQARRHNKAFEERQLEEKRSFFERVESNPLTDEQARAVICMDDEVLVVAAAGSGKSSTIVAKAGYAIEEGLCEPEEILLLAFNNAAAKELRERIAKRLGHLEGSERIKAMTFHGFGLEVIGQGTGKMPTTAPWLGHTGEDEAYIGHLVDELCECDKEFAMRYAMFRLVYFKDVGSWDVLNDPEDWDPDEKRRGFRTLDGEIVRSESERILADLLFLHGVNYIYEEPYPVDTRTEHKKQYRPDFYYPDIDVWHEHWALNAKGEPPKAFEGYLESIEWKCKLHHDHGTTLFETTTHGVRTNEAQLAVLDMLRKHGMDPVFDPNRKITGREPVSPQAVSRLLRVFQQHMKSSQRRLDEIRAVAANHPDMMLPRVNLFLSIYEQVAALWEERLVEGGVVDFEDMLNLSAEIIETRRYRCKFKMILADEFQDTSRARMRLIRAVVKDSGAQLTAVGDDWQSIYRFAGSDIAIMGHFQQAYPYASIRHLSETFRCPQDLCDLTSKFVAKNPMQIAKVVRTHNLRPGPSLRVVALPDVGSIEGRVKQQLDNLYRKLDAQGERVSVLLLGRYRRDRPEEYGAWKIGLKPWIDLHFLTVHRAKGLEADIVLVLNVVDGNLGFPSRVEDDPIIQLAMPEPEAFAFGEERRLFYVALTRARRSVVIYTTQTNPSPFIAELQKDFGVEIAKVDGVPQEQCSICERGFKVDRVNRATLEVFQSCSRFPRCDGKRQRTWEDAHG